jgi:hypothetical protein
LNHKVTKTSLDGSGDPCQSVGVCQTVQASLLNGLTRALIPSKMPAA